MNELTEFWPGFCFGALLMGALATGLAVLMLESWRAAADRSRVQCVWLSRWLAQAEAEASDLRERLYLLQVERRSLPGAPGGPMANTTGTATGPTPTKEDDEREDWERDGDWWKKEGSESGS